MNINETDRIPEIDYETHPAFSNIGITSRSEDLKIQQILDTVDLYCTQIARENTGSAATAEAGYRNKVLPKLNELRRLVFQEGRFDDQSRRFVDSAIERASGFLLEGVLSRVTSSASGKTAAGTGERACLQALLAEGCCKVGIEASLAKRVWDSTWWERALLRRRAKSEPARHCVIALSDYSPGSLAIQNALHAAGVIDSVSSYIGREMEFIYAALEYSHDRQNWYKDCYVDAGIPTSKTVYMHFDADHSMMKGMLYIQDVALENGPFRYIRGSHKWRRSAAVCALERGFDAEQAARFELEEDGLDYKLGYYRPRYKLREYRKMLLLLPKALRGSTHFGDDIMDGTTLSDSLLRQEEVFVGPAGTFVVFDGSHGIHRGSQVERGERWAVQVGMRVVKSLGKRTFRSLLRPIYGRLRYQWLRASDVLTSIRSRDV